MSSEYERAIEDVRAAVKKYADNNKQIRREAIGTCNDEKAWAAGGRIVGALEILGLLDTIKPPVEGERKGAAFYALADRLNPLPTTALAVPHDTPPQSSGADVAELRALLAKGTPGPWEARKVDSRDVIVHATNTPTLDGWGLVAKVERPQDTALIAAMHDALTALVDEIEMLRAASKVRR
jgi:hypothetical protein